jgi:hypothetical protein
MRKLAWSILFLSSKPAEPGSSFSKDIAQRPSNKNRRSSPRRAVGTIGCLLALGGSILVPVVHCFGGARRFTFVYEAPTTPPGVIEAENWVTWQMHPPNESHFNEVDFRHEVEFGITNNFQASLYLADWNYHSALSHLPDDVSYTDTAIELIYNFSNPLTDPVGLSGYEEIQAGDRHGELESKLIAQRDFGRFVASYNLTLEAEWNGAGWKEHDGELQQALGLSYELSPRFFLGSECLHEVALPNWTDHGRVSFFVGPNFSIRSGRWWMTVTPLAQATSNGDEPQLQLRTIAGYTF